MPWHPHGPWHARPTHAAIALPNRVRMHMPPSPRRRKLTTASPVAAGSLAYSRTVGLSLSLRPATVPAAPFPLTSLSEDLHFVERALRRCHRLLPISGVPLVYVRHGAVHNTWQPANLTQRMRGDSLVPPPTFVDAELRAAYVTAERDAARLGACKAVARHPPSDIARPLRTPFNPWACCRSARAAGHHERLLRPCQDGSRDCGETYCGSTKGVCTATCTCAGEAAHGREGAIPCGRLCCKYWGQFWRTHPANCSAPGTRPLKRLYCRGSLGSIGSPRSSLRGAGRM